MILYEVIRHDIRYALELEKSTMGIYILKMTSQHLTGLPQRMSSVFRICMTKQEFEGVLELMYQAKLEKVQGDDDE